jgi:hypothetical protein
MVKCNFEKRRDWLVGTRAEREWSEMSAALVCLKNVLSGYGDIALNSTILVGG